MWAVLSALGAGSQRVPAILAVHPTERNEHGAYPIFVSGTYGKGPVLFCGVDATRTRE